MSEGLICRASFAFSDRSLDPDVHSPLANIMAKMVLSDQDIQSILNELKLCYSLISVGWADLESKLLAILRKMAASDVAVQPIRDLLLELEKSYDGEVWREKNERVFRSCFILILVRRNPSLLLSTVKEFLLEFPEFVDCCAEEHRLMLKFRNMMKCGIYLYDAKSHKGKLMELAGRLSGKLCTTGGGSTPDTKRRELIYERLGGVKKKKLTVPRRTKKREELRLGKVDLSIAYTPSNSSTSSLTSASSKASVASTASTSKQVTIPKRGYKRARQETQYTKETRVKKEVGPEKPSLDKVEVKPESFDSDILGLYSPFPMERAISTLTTLSALSSLDVDVGDGDAGDLLHCDTSSFPCSPVYSTNFSGACFDEQYFSDKWVNTPINDDKEKEWEKEKERSLEQSEMCLQYPNNPFPHNQNHPLPPNVNLNLNHPYAPPAPMLQRGLTIDLSKPIFNDEFSFHLDLSMF